MPHRMISIYGSAIEFVFRIPENGDYMVRVKLEVSSHPSGWA